MKKIAIIFILVAFIILSIAPFALADEITPAPGTYNYGSTSEFSPYAGGGPGPGPGPGPTPSPQPTPGDLAPTGQNLWILYAIATIAIVSPLAVLGYRRSRKG